MRILIFILCCWFILPLQAQEATIKFYYNDPAVDTLLLLDADKISLKKAPRNKDSLYILISDVDTGYYFLNAGKEYFNLYLQPGYDLEVRSDYHTPDSTLNFTGKGAAENNYLAKKSIIQINAQNENPFSANIDQEAVVEKSFKEQQKLLDKSGIRNKYFIQQETSSLYYEAIGEKIGRFIYQKHINKNSEAAAKSDSLIRKISMNEGEMTDLPSYIQLLAQVMMNASQNMKVDTTRQASRDFGVNVLSMADSLITHQNLKDKVMYALMHFITAMPVNREASFDIFNAKVKNERFLAKINEKKDLFAQSKAGSLSKDFTYTDPKDEPVTLSSLRGKYVYIDIWATWCMPCKREMPHLETLQEEMKDKNIAFVSICAMDKKDAWINFINSRKMAGIQLFAAASDDFMKSYQVSSIPRFILIDPAGRIVDPNAKRPSDPELKAELENILSN